MLLAILQSQHGADYFYYIYHIRNFKLIMENVIYHIRRCLKLDCFMSTKWPPDCSVNQQLYYYLQQKLGNEFKLCTYQLFAAFLLQPLKSTEAYSVIDVNNEVKLTI